jgi:site-specific recombinase XerD
MSASKMVRRRRTDAAASVAIGPDQILEGDFQQYLVKERGLAARTVEHYMEAAHVFLNARSDEDERDPSAWTAADVLTFVLRCARSDRPRHMQQLCSGLRCFLRYLRFRGEIHRDLADSVPRIAHWRLATLPKSLTRAQVRQVLAHCNRHTSVGRRNYAVLMLLVRLGLRAHEICSLMLDDIDWRSGQLTIRSKGTGPEPMPLSTDVGKALAAYLKDGRPPSSSRVVFVRMVPPHTPLADSKSVTSIAARALRVAGVDSPCKGAHVFRYTLGTQMLRDGASLREIGQVLRHKSEDTTRLYAKVDLVRLRTLAMPWPGGAS